MLDTTFFNKIKKEFVAKDGRRRQVIKDAGDILHASKRSIFALHRNDASTARALLESAVAALKKLERELAKHPGLKDEGSLLAAQEELVEAHVFFNMVHKTKAGAVKGVHIQPHVYLAGMLDVPGELVRFAIREASHRNYEAVVHAQRCVDKIMDFVIEINLTGYVRTKYDQAKQMAKKMEEIAYDMSRQRG